MYPMTSRSHPISHATCKLLFALFSALNVVAFQEEGTLSCLSLLRKDETMFKLCENPGCFLIQADPPFVNLDPSMVAQNNQTPFRCEDRVMHFPDLDGSIFYVKDSIQAFRNAFCVYSGNNCSVTSMLNFIEEHSGPNSKYRFFAFGLQVPYRASRYAKTTFALAERQAVLVLIRNEQMESGNIFSRMASTFDLSALLCIFVAVAAILTLGLLTILVFNGRVTLPIIIQNILGDHDPAQQNPAPILSDGTDLNTHQAELRQGVSLAMATLKLALHAVLFTVTLISGVVGAYWLITNSPEAVHVDLDGLTRNELSEFMVPADSPLASAFKYRVTSVKMVGRGEKVEIGDTQTPYHFCNDQADCFKKLEDRDHPAKKLVISRPVAMEYLQENKACDRFVIYPEKKSLFTYYRVWHMSSSVPREVQASIDRSIWFLRLKGKAQALLSRDTGSYTSQSCEDQSPRLQGKIIWPLIAFPVVPLLVFALIVIVWGHARRRTNRRPPQEERL